VDLRAERAGASSEVEFAALRAIFAYEEALSYTKGKRTRATGTWQMVNRSGLIPAIARRLASGVDTSVDQTLKELGMEDYSFAAVQEGYPEFFGRMAA
jgi:hypothetical protein